MRLEAELLAAEQRAEPSEPANHFVADHEYVVLGAHRHDFLEVGLRRHDDAAGAHDRLGDEGRNRFRVLPHDQRFELIGEPRGELFLGLAILGEAVMVRAAGMEEARQGKVEIADDCRVAR